MFTSSEASNFAAGVDKAFIIIIGISLFFLISITATMLFFVFKYNKKRNPKATQYDGSTTLEIVWTVIPLVLVMIMFYYGYIAFKPQREVPKDALQITAIGKMWDWSFEYENGKKLSKELIVPLNKPVKLNLVSLDVIHSLFIPAFRIKEDLVPGKEDNYMWFIPTMKGTYEILCTEYCGLRHSYMESKVIVMDEKDYTAWLTALPIKTNREENEGYKILQNNACMGCHSNDGSKLVGPTFKKLYSRKTAVITNGSERTVVTDENYLKESILDPNKDIVKGFSPGLMKSYKGVVSDKEINAIIEYFKLPEEK